MNKALLPMAAILALPLGGCVYAAAAGALASAAGSGSGGAQEPPDPGAARVACSERAASHGTVRIIDTVEREGGLRVFGAVENDGSRQSFVCEFRGGRVTGFRLRAIP
jgi:hypothetical protein